MESVEVLHGFTRYFEYFVLQHFSLKSIGNLSKSKRIDFRYKIYFAFTILLLTLIAAYLIFFTTIFGYSKLHKINAKNLLNVLLQFSTTFGTIFLNVMCSMECYFKTTKSKEIFLLLHEVGNIFEAHLPYKMELMKFRNQMIKQLIMIILLIVSIFTIFAIVTQMKSQHAFMALILGQILILFIYMTIIRFAFYVSIVNFSLECIIMNLKALFPSKSIADSKIITVENSSSSDIKQKLLYLRKACNKTYELSTIVNSLMEISILFIVAWCVINVTSSGYHLFLIVVGSLDRHHIYGL